MALARIYHPDEVEPRLQAFWEQAGVYHFSLSAEGPVFSIDTPPATVSGRLHLGHAYSYTHADLIARFRRMKGENVFYPMGYDDNGLPTERLVERQLGGGASQIGRAAFIRECLRIGEQAGQEYRQIWQRLGLSIDWRYTYRTIGERAQKACQKSFLELHRQGLVYREQAPAIWCPHCGTAIAQADVDDLERTAEFLSLAFQLEDGNVLPIATTRPELLPACVAVFVHPKDERFGGLSGRFATVPLFGQRVRILEDAAVDPQKGSGAVMCCTFGDATDKAWWIRYSLPLIEAIDRHGRLTGAAGEFAGLSVEQARREISAALESRNLLLDRKRTPQIVRVHERCDTPVEYVMSRQWFIRLLDFKDQLLEAGEQVNWFPASMKARYRSWVENLAWDWCISRQRAFGVPSPIWYCQACGQAMLAEDEQLPVDPQEARPARPCASCGSRQFTPERDVFDTWATSSLTPQIAGRWPEIEAGGGDGLYARVFPFSLRPQAHEIIRTWAFYTIAKSLFHFGCLPWKDAAISGWGVAGGGAGKVSKSRGGGPLDPLEAMQRYSADAVRYWAASTALGKDAVISEEKMRVGARLVTKLWNAARFSEPFLAGYRPEGPAGPASADRLTASLPPFTLADRWLLSCSQRLIRRATQHMEDYEYALAKSEIEHFFWNRLADNYLEMCKQRLYAEGHPQRAGALWTLYRVLLTTLQLLAPFLPHVAEEIYQGLFAGRDAARPGEVPSIHRSRWPEPEPALEDEQAETAGEVLVALAAAIRRYKSERRWPQGAPLERLEVACQDPALAALLESGASDLASVSRARRVAITPRLDPTLEIVHHDGKIQAGLRPLPAPE